MKDDIVEPLRFSIFYIRIILQPLSRPKDCAGTLTTFPKHQQLLQIVFITSHANFYCLNFSAHTDTPF